MLITCPYCLQKIDTRGQEKPYFRKGKDFRPNNKNPKCPKCELRFKFSKKDGVLRIKSEEKKYELPSSFSTEGPWHN